MTSVLPRKKFSCIFVNKLNWCDELLNTIEDRVNQGENILILLEDLDEGTNNLELEIKKKLWRKLGDYKVQILFVPEVTSIIFPETTKVVFK